MFKFDFDLDEDSLDEITIQNQVQSKRPPKLPKLNVSEPSQEISIDALVGALPPLISYSPLNIPIASSRKKYILPRRDLFDARFQLISEGAGDTKEDAHDATANSQSEAALKFLDAPSDLVPGVYEGGLKTWECSLDLVDYLDSLKDESAYQGFLGKAILELGCGTALPSAYIFHEILAGIWKGNGAQPSLSTVIHVQDYNASVLQLVTLPNFLLVWYASPLANNYRASISDPDLAPLLDPATPGELPITPELKQTFLASLRTCRIDLRFTSGSWDTFDPTNSPPSSGYDVLLTSETIYQPSSLPSLLKVVRSAYIHKMKAESVGESVMIEASPPLYLFAAKILYFGVGGGIVDFLSVAVNAGAAVKDLLERKAGVSRKVMSITWRS